MGKSPRIVAYHPVVRVFDDSDSVLVELDLDDWYTEEEILGILREACGSPERVRDVADSLSDCSETVSGLVSGRILVGEAGDTFSISLEKLDKQA